jgi:hypothetical protein
MYRSYKYLPTMVPFVRRRLGLIIEYGFVLAPSHRYPSHIYIRNVLFNTARRILQHHQSGLNEALSRIQTPYSATFSHTIESVI